MHVLRGVHELHGLHDAAVATTLAVKVGAELITDLGGGQAGGGAVCMCVRGWGV